MSIDKFLKVLTEDEVAELQAMDADSLRNKICLCTQNIQICKEEMEGNPNYQKASEDKSVFTKGFNEARKRQNAFIAVALQFLDEKVYLRVCLQVSDSEKVEKS
jgi:hypothetical protein